MRKALLTPVIVAALALASGGWFLQKGAAQEKNVYAQARLFDEVLHYVQNRFVEPETAPQLYDKAIEGMLSELGDPHSVLLDPKEYEDLHVQTSGEYGGLGIQIAVRDGWVTVISPLPGTPAERAGLQAGDRIVEVEGESTHGWTDDKAVAELRGPKGEPVDIKIARVGADQLIPFHIVRDEIHVTSVPASYMLGNGVGYVELTVFSESSTDSVRAAIDGLRQRGAKSIILDMRQNPGGLLDQAISLGDLFLQRGQLVAETKGRVAADNRSFSAASPDAFAGMPMVVLVGPQSASATEILSGALQDHDRALVLGERTFGKGSVQTLFPLRAGDYFLKLTTARWYTPSGRSIQGPYGVGLEQNGGRLTQQDTAAPPDTFRTDAGRAVVGGGGIHPDLVVRDTLTASEQALVRSLNNSVSAYMDALYGFAVAYVHDHSGLKKGFDVGPAVLDAFYASLQKHGVDLRRDIYDAGSDWMVRQLGFRIAYARWGQEQARERWNRQDRQVQVAQQILEKADRPSSVFALARAWSGSPQAPAPSGESGGGER